ncbi:MAG: type II/IV secretion system protein [Phycisphaeraceae bacterium]|nr:type II/IV secretion system protein [Phycisphaeraceae bacterium]
MLSSDDFVIAALIEDGRLTTAGVNAARRRVAERPPGAPANFSVCDALVEQGLLTGRELAIARAHTTEFLFVDLGNYEINHHNASRVPRSVCESIGAFPLFIMDELVVVGMLNPLDLHAADQLRALLKCDIEAVLCEPEPLRALIARAFDMMGDSSAFSSGSGSAAIGDLELTSGREPIVAAVNQIIGQGIDLGASDVHLGPDEHELHLRYRIDGTLQPHQAPSIAAHQGMVQRLKVMANLDLTQTRRPQDGKFRFTHKGRQIDIRLSIIPTVCGENAVLRILHSGASIKGFAELGFPADATTAFERIIEHPHGMILVTGPTGSGKTTTLYTCLKRLNSPEFNIVTIEDPVEIRLPLVRQVQINHEIGMTFASALRSVLRQDPDVVFVGEIRDEETARISVQAALTGHLVLSSLHTNDAAGAVARLTDLGCPPFAINSALLCVIGQRLVRRNCPDCVVTDHPSQHLRSRFRIQDETTRWTRGRGCPRCASTGFRGRVGVYEMLRMTEPLRALVDTGASTDAIRAMAISEGMSMMWHDGLNKARLGVTTLEEVARVVALQESEPGHSSDQDSMNSGLRLKEAA